MPEMVIVLTFNKKTISSLTLEMVYSYKVAMFCTAIK